MIIVLKVDAPLGTAIGVKEAIAVDLEKYGDVRVVAVFDEKVEQVTLEEIVRGERGEGRR